MPYGHHHHRRHHRHNHYGGYHYNWDPKRLGFKKFERFITQYFLLILGVVFLIAGGVYLFLSHGGGAAGSSILDKFLSYFTTVEAPGGTGSSGVSAPFSWSGALWFIPGILLLVFPFFIKKQAFAKYSAFAGTAWIFLFHLIILKGGITGGFSYPTIWVAIGATVAVCVIPIWHAYRMRQIYLVWAVIFMFYLSFFFLNNNYNWIYYWRLIYILSFTWIILILCFKTGKLIPFYLSSFFAILMLGLFWWHNIALSSNINVSAYLFVSTLFYLTILMCSFGIELSQRNVMYELAALILALVNVIFYWISILFVLHKAGYPDSEALFTMILATFNVLLIYSSPKRNSNFTRSFYIIVTLFLFSMVVPLWAHHNHAIFFPAIFSILLIFYSQFANSRPALVTSMVFLGIACFVFVLKWVFIYFFQYWHGTMPMYSDVFTNGLQAGFAVVAAVTCRYMLKRPDMPLPEWFALRRTRRFLKVFIILGLYLTGFWCWHFILSQVWPLYDVWAPIWFSYTCLYMIVLLVLIARQRSSMLRPLLWLAIMPLPAYPLVVNPVVRDILEIAFLHVAHYRSCFQYHYLLLPIMLTLVWLLYYYFKKSRKHKRYIVHIVQAVIIGFCLWVFLVEYDLFTAFFGFRGKGQMSDMITVNHHLPWSIILLVASFLMAGYSLIRHHRFIRQLSFLLFLAATAKILVIDFQYLEDETKTGLLFGLGGILVVFSLFYQRFRRVVRDREQKVVTRDAESPSPGPSPFGAGKSRP